MWMVKGLKNHVIQKLRREDGNQDVTSDGAGGVVWGDPSPIPTES